MIGESFEEGLRAEGYAVEWVRNGRDAELAAANNVYDLMLLDLGLPDRQGLDVLAGYRKAGGEAPVLIVTARDATFDRIKGLDSGADDHLIKPFDLDEAFARIRALLRRLGGRAQPSIVHRGLVLNPAMHDATLDGKLLYLSAREFVLLHALLDSPGQVARRDGVSRLQS